MIEQIELDRVWTVQLVSPLGARGRIVYSGLAIDNYGNTACTMQSHAPGRLGVGEQSQYWGPWCFFLGVF